MYHMMYAYYTICILCQALKKPSKQKISPEPQFTPAQLLGFFLELLPCAELCALPSLATKRFYTRLFSPMVILWYMLFQRLNHDHTLDAAVSDAHSGGADALNKKLSSRLKSSATTSLSDARQRIPASLLGEVLTLQGGKIAALSSSTRWRGFVLALLDGSTVRLRPQGDIPDHFPAQRNQHPGRCYWCLMRVVVCFCTLTGAALDCTLDSTHVSEQVLACQIILRTAVAALFIGDRNFGVFRVIQAARQANHHVLVRLTNARVVKLLGRSLVLGDHEVNWSPSSYDQVEPACSKDPVHGRLLIVRLKRRGFKTQLLCLFTTLCSAADYSVEELVRLYGLRWHIELNLRYLKAQMDMNLLEVQSAEMARKEWLAGLIAYNLIRAAMLCAALKKEISPLRLSFSASRRRLEYWLREFGRTKRRALASWEQLLKQISRCSFANRKKPRPTEPRAQRHLRLPYPALYGSRTAARRKLKKANRKS